MPRNCLVIDSTGRWLSVGVFGERSHQIVLDARREASTRLVAVIDETLHAALVRRPDWIVCLRGPGSFTGIRIGVSTARTLAQLWDIPVIGIDSTAAYAYSCLLAEGQLSEVCVQIDGKQNRVYARRLERTRALNQIQEEGPLDLPAPEVFARYPHATHFVDDVDAVARYLGGSGLSPAYRPLPELRPEYFFTLALELGGETRADSYESLTPLYLRQDSAHAKFPEGFTVRQTET